MLRNCDCGACCEECGHYDDCIRNAVRERDVADEVALEDGYRPARLAAATGHPSMLPTRRHFEANPLPAQQDRRAS